MESFTNVDGVASSWTRATMELQDSNIKKQAIVGDGYCSRLDDCEPTSVLDLSSRLSPPLECTCFDYAGFFPTGSCLDSHPDPSCPHAHLCWGNCHHPAIPHPEFLQDPSVVMMDAFSAGADEPYTLCLNPATNNWEEENCMLEEEEWMDDQLFLVPYLENDLAYMQYGLHDSYSTAGLYPNSYPQIPHALISNGRTFTAADFRHTESVDMEDYSALSSRTDNPSVFRLQEEYSAPSSRTESPDVSSIFSYSAPPSRTESPGVSSIFSYSAPPSRTESPGVASLFRLQEQEMDVVESFIVNTEAPDETIIDMFRSSHPATRELSMGNCLETRASFREEDMKPHFLMASRGADNHRDDVKPQFMDSSGKVVDMMGFPHDPATLERMPARELDQTSLQEAAAMALSSQGAAMPNSAQQDGANSNSMSKSGDWFPISSAATSKQNVKLSKTRKRSAIDKDSDTVPRALVTRESMELIGHLMKERQANSATVWSSSNGMDHGDGDGDGGAIAIAVAADDGLRLVHHLLACAEAVAWRDVALAASLLDRLRTFALYSGDSIQRVTCCFAEGLSARLLTMSRSPELLRPLEFAIPTKAQRTEGLLQLYQCSPYISFGIFAANEAILQAFEGKKEVHIIDLGMVHRLQWSGLIRALASREEGPPSLRITVIGETVREVEEWGRELEELAGGLKVPLELRGASEVLDASILTRSNLGVQEGETVAINSVLQLHRVAKESRGSLKGVLQALNKLSPAVMTIVEQDASHNGPFFLGRFLEALHYYSAIFDSLEASLPRNSKQRLMVERLYYAEEIRNIVACEGAERVERHERAEQWRRQLSRAGFQAVPLKFMSQARMMLSLYSCDGSYTLVEEKSGIILGWKGTPIIIASAWKSAGSRPK